MKINLRKNIIKQSRKCISMKNYFILIAIIWLAILGILCGCSDSDMIIQSLMDISGAPMKYEAMRINFSMLPLSVCMACSQNKA